MQPQFQRQPQPAAQYQGMSLEDIIKSLATNIMNFQKRDKGKYPEFGESNEPASHIS